jgi:hypothetical protein
MFLKPFLVRTHLYKSHIQKILHQNLLKKIFKQIKKHNTL